jgi:hypothetical protein
LLRRGRLLGKVPVRKDLTGKKLYADETGALESYALITASAGSLQIVSYDQARDHDLFWRHSEKALLAVALGTQPIGRVRSVDAREAELCARNATKWAARREATTPGPFGDVQQLTDIVKWIEDYGIENTVERSHNLAIGAQGYGRPNEGSERRPYAFAGLVALWRGTWSKDRWPAELAERLPAPPGDQLMVKALNAARALANQVITRDAELRLIWDGAEDRGAEFRGLVTALQTALS